MAKAPSKNRKTPLLGIDAPRSEARGGKATGKSPVPAQLKAAEGVGTRLNADLAQATTLLAQQTDTAVGYARRYGSATARANRYQSLFNDVVGTVFVRINALSRAWAAVPGFVKALVPGSVRISMEAVFQAVAEFDRRKGQLEQDYGRELSDYEAAFAALPKITGPVAIDVWGAEGVGKTTILNALRSVLPDSLPVRLTENTVNGPTLVTQDAVASRVAPIEKADHRA